MNNQALGNSIRTLRKQSGFTQERLAEKAGISTSFLGHIERGSRVVSVKTLVSLASALETTPDTLLADSITRSPFTSPTKNTHDFIDVIRKNLDLLQKTLI